MKPKDKCATCAEFGKGRCIGDDVLLEKADAILDVLEDDNGAVDIEASLMMPAMAAGTLLATAGDGNGEATAKALMRYMQDVTDAVNGAVHAGDLPEVVKIPPRQQMQ